MKKNTIRAFTLVEMLIVIVIIGILIAALMPRMSAAQGRARDVARKTDLSQMQTALISYYGDHAKFPQASQTWEEIKAGSNTEKALKEMGMTSVPRDPQQGSKISIIAPSTAGAYRAKVVKRNDVSDAGLLLVAHVEVPGSANAVSCSTTTDKDIADMADSKDFKPCKDITESNESTKKCLYVPDGNCTYASDTDLVYVVAY